MTTMAVGGGLEKVLSDAAQFAGDFLVDCASELGKKATAGIAAVLGAIGLSGVGEAISSIGAGGSANFNDSPLFAHGKSPGVTPVAISPNKGAEPSVNMGRSFDDALERNHHVSEVSLGGLTDNLHLPNMRAMSGRSMGMSLS